MKISIIMATYNAEKTLRRAIQSVVNQNYANVELIIIDGQSTDKTLNIIKEYEEYVSYWVSEPDQGVYDAMNKGIAKASGDVIAFLNSDDWYEKNAFEQVQAYFDQYEIDVLVGEVNCVMNNHVFQRQSSFQTPDDIRIKMIYCHQGMFVKKEVFDQIGNFNLKYRIVADYEWTLKCYLQGFRFMTVENVFANYRCDGLSSIQVYKLEKEQREVSCNYASGSKEILLRIKQYYDNRWDSLESTFYNLVWSLEPQFVRELLGEKVSYYIWGAGECGKQCCILFWSVDSCITGFVDKDGTKKECMGYPVTKLVQLQENEKICISSERYEEEIKKQILELGFSEDKITYFSKIKRQMIEYAKKELYHCVVR